MAFKPEALVKARKAANWSQATLAAAVGLTDQTISNYETGKTAPNVFMARALAVALGCESSLLSTDERNAPCVTHA